MSYNFTMSSQGLLIIYSGPSGVGKGTIFKELLKDESLNLVFSISMTTRKPRINEVDGVNYYFVSKDFFEQEIANNGFLEYAKFVDNYYGTPLEFVNKQRENGKNVLLEIEVQGAQEVMHKCPDNLSIFIMPPSIEELENRIRLRNTESDEVIKSRIAVAKEEIKKANLYSHIVINDSVENCVSQIKKIILDRINKSK